MTTNEADFDKRGTRYREAFLTLCDGCEIPPSFELFSYQLALEQRTNPGMSPEGLARRLSESYHRVTGFFPGTP